MHLCGINRVVFAAANADAEPFGLSTAALYQQLSRPLAEQTLRIEQQPHSAMRGLYQRWQAQHG